MCKVKQKQSAEYCLRWSVIHTTQWHVMSRWETSDSLIHPSGILSITSPSTPNAFPVHTTATPPGTSRSTGMVEPELPKTGAASTLTWHIHGKDWSLLDGKTSWKVGEVTVVGTAADDETGRSELAAAGIDAVAFAWGASNCVSTCGTPEVSSPCGAPTVAVAVASARNTPTVVFLFGM